MSLKVIELNDAMLKVGDASGIVCQSPGFALAQDKALVLGEAAEQQAKLHPTHSYNKYWYELSVDPLPHGKFIRHYADLAYAQLQDLMQQAAIENDVLLAVPGNFTRQQLAILLGLAKTCQLNIVGVVDSALAAAQSHLVEKQLVYAEQQLHQVVLTRLNYNNNALGVDTVVQIPGVGSQNMIDQIMQLATNAFIQQCRFNPQHNAETEQQLYNAVSGWWRQSNVDESGLVLELQVGSNAYTAKMPRETLISSLGNHYKKIQQQLVALTNSGSNGILLNSGIASLPGLRQLVDDKHIVKAVSDDAIIRTCLDYEAQIRSHETGIKLVSSLTLSTGPGNSDGSTVDTKTVPDNLPTHVLYRHQAIPLTALRANGNLNLPKVPGDIISSPHAVILDSGNKEFLLNAQPVKGRLELALGDRVQEKGSSDTLTLIRVH